MTPVDRAAVESLDNHPKDRHVAAIAVTSHADGTVTLNVRDFRSRVLRDSDIAILTPGKLLEGVVDDRPELGVLAVGHLASRWVNPPRAPSEITADLAVHPTMAAPMRRLRSLLDHG